MTTSIGSGSSHVYPQPFLPGSSRSVGWSIRHAFEGALRVADRGIAILMDWYDIAQERRTLGSMSDEMLKDIGISRADAMREASRRFWDTGETR
jgi:uncharacterized protein YjiS (DUF1127 family)